MHLVLDMVTIAATASSSSHRGVPTVTDCRPWHQRRPSVPVRYVKPPPHEFNLNLMRDKNST
jgi:hypothetical protein